MGTDPSNHSNLAGFLPPQRSRRFYSCIVPSLVYMLFGTSRHVHVGVNAPISLMVAVTIKELGAATDERRVAIALAITAISSVVYLAMMALRLDLIATFVPDPVVSGFCTAMALQIMSTNLKYVVGVSLDTDSVLATLADLARKARRANPAAAAVFAAGCALLLGIRELNARYFRLAPIPEQLVLLVAATYVSRAFDLERVAGPAPPAPPPQHAREYNRTRPSFLRDEKWRIKTENIDAPNF